MIETLIEALVQWAADGNADADQRDAHFCSGPDDETDRVSQIIFGVEPLYFGRTLDTSGVGTDEG